MTIKTEDIDFEKLYEALLTKVKVSPTARDDISRLKNVDKNLLDLYVYNALGFVLGELPDPLDVECDKIAAVLSDLYPNILDELIDNAKKSATNS
jgi:hypothetical protein